VVAGAAGLVVAAGLVAGSNPVGDALYAVLLFVLVVGIAPAVTTGAAAFVTFGLCAAVELLQLTGLPAAVVERSPAARYVLGTTFHGPDLLAYAAGVLLAAAVDALARRRAAGRRAVTPSESGRARG
jgi:hypothetical protein